jgi:hypothetical protein
MKNKIINQVFKIGDRVFDIEYGWGKVFEINHLERHSVRVIFDDNLQRTYLFDGKYPCEGGYPRNVLSFTEYTLQGFSQERPEELPNKGDIVWVRFKENFNWIIGHFSHKVGENYYISLDNSEVFDYGSEITTLNPYLNEN